MRDTYIAEFISLEESKYPQIRTKIGNTLYRSILDDNCYTEDFYRYHDIIHFGMAAYWGYSPQFFSYINDNQGYSKTSLETEEAIITIIFSIAEDHSFFLIGEVIKWDQLRILNNMLGMMGVYITLERLKDSLVKIFEVMGQIVESSSGFIEINLKEGYIKYLGKTP